MGYGGLLNKVIDPFGIGGSDAPDPADPSAVGRDFRSLLNAYIQAQPTLLSTAQQFQPQYLNLGINSLNTAFPAAQNVLDAGNSATRTADVGDATRLGPAAGGAVRGIYDAANPDSAPLLSALTRTATTGLAAGSKLLPEDVNRIVSSTRSDWSNRGLGASDPAALSEAVNQATAGENVRQGRQTFAQGVYDRNGAVNTLLTGPAMGLVTSPSQAPALAQVLSSGAASNGVNPSSVYDMFNTAYNARSAANIAGANNAAAENSY